MAEADSVRIRHLGLRGPAPAREPAVRALQHAAWPAAPGGGVLMLRRLRVSAAADTLGAAAAEQARALAARAVDGFSPAAGAAGAVWFASRAALLACLCRDLLAGRAGGLWFWAGWRHLLAHPPAVAAARALEPEALELPAVLTALAGHPPAWSAFWRELPDPDAHRLLAAVQRDTGWPAATAALAPSPTGPAHADGEVAGEPILPPLPTPRPDPAGPRALLAAVTEAWGRQPHRLSGPNAVALLRGLARAMAAAPPPAPGGGRGVTPPGARTAAGGDRRPGTAPPQGAPLPVPPAAGGPARGNFGTVAPAAAPPAPGDTRPETALPASRRTGGAATGAPVEDTPGERPAPPPGKDAGPEPAAGRSADGVQPPAAVAREAGLVVGQGGLFYLLNALRPAAVQRRLVADPLPLAGWRWLLALGLGLGLDLAHDPTLARLLAALLEQREPDGLHRVTASVPVGALLRLGRRRFGPAAWNAGLLAVPALVRRDRSHLDVHYRMADVRLAVRRAGLDVDPGWLPWLGRVVRFHYDDPEALGTGAP